MNGKVNQPNCIPVTIRQHQIAHFTRKLAILKKHKIVINGSKPGTGKTWMGTAIVQELDLIPIIIVPGAIRGGWTRCLQQTNTVIYKNADDANHDYILTYEGLRGVKGCRLKHGLLNRYDSDDGYVEFTPTQKLIDMVNYGTCFIFDECQKFKNDCEISKAIRVIFDLVMNTEGTKSRIMMLSGSIANNPEHIVNFLRVMQAICHRNLYTQFGLEGLAELQQFGKQLNPKATADFMFDNPIDHQDLNTDEAHKYIMKFWKAIIQPELYTYMPGDPDQKTRSKQYLFNLIYPMDVDDYATCSRAVSNLARALRYNDDVGGVGIQKDMGAVTNCLMQIQISKVNMMVEVARTILETEFYDSEGNILRPKVALFADYREVWEALEKALADYNPLTLTGKESSRSRTLCDQIIADYCKDDDERRVIITNPDVGGLGIELDDKFGTRPRIGLLMPGYKANSLYQSVNRFDRAGTLGVSMCFVMYGYSPDDTTVNNPLIAAAISSTTSVTTEVETEATDVHTLAPAAAVTEPTKRRKRRGKRSGDDNSDATGRPLLETRIFESLYTKGHFTKNIHEDPDAIFPGEYQDLIVVDRGAFPFIPEEWMPVNLYTDQQYEQEQSQEQQQEQHNVETVNATQSVDQVTSLLHHTHINSGLLSCVSGLSTAISCSN